MKRDTEIREKANILLEELLELYEVTDPSFVEKTEDQKLENARKSIDVFWQLFDLLTYWAQCHILALARSNVDTEFINQIMDEHPETHINSHVLEDVGDQFMRSIGEDFKNEETIFFADDADYLKSDGRLDQILRHHIFEMLASRTAKSHPWRYLMQKSLRALNEGQIESLLKPPPIRRTGKPFYLNQWKLEAVIQVLFRVGQGMKKYRALEIVSEGVGQSVDTIRDWEKNFKFDDEYLDEMKCSELAGQHEREFKNGVDISIGFHEYGSHRGRPIIEIAHSLMEVIENRTFQEISSNIRKYRQ